MPGEAADRSINHVDAIKYWSSVESSVNGMLGGFPHISQIDLSGSLKFAAKLRRQAETAGNTRKPFLRAADCGAGIGRITSGLLVNLAEVVDIVEPVEKFTREISHGKDFAKLRDENRIGDVYNVGLEKWTPTRKYDLIWNQWCLGQLTDEQLTSYLVRCKSFLLKPGFIVVKENMTTEPDGADLFDEVDSSVTRSERKLRAIFAAAELKIVATELQKGFPRGLFPVRTFALQPKDWDA